VSEGPYFEVPEGMTLPEAVNAFLAPHGLCAEVRPISFEPGDAEEITFTVPLVLPKEET
jgi:hypothetical protein